jgi:hypothetical protein
MALPREEPAIVSYDLIRQAIIEKKGIAAVYNGQYREMCPHVIGTKKGKRHALFYQFGGQSNSRPIEPDGSSANWRCIDVDGLSNVALLDIAEWHSAPDHSRPQTCVDYIDVEVQF